MVIIGNLGSPNRNKTSSIHKKKINRKCLLLCTVYIPMYMYIYYFFDINSERTTQAIHSTHTSYRIVDKSVRYDTASGIANRYMKSVSKCSTCNQLYNHFSSLFLSLSLSRSLARSFFKVNRQQYFELI